MIPYSRLEPDEVIQEGASVRISNETDEPEVVLYFKSEENASLACRSLRNYLEIVDVERQHESVMHMLEVVLGRAEGGD